MPLVNAYGIGGSAVARGKTTLVGRIGADPAQVSTSRTLLVENLPTLQLRAVQQTNTGAGLGATLELQGMIRETLATSAKWDTYATFAMPAGGVQLFPFGNLGLTLPVSHVRLRMTAAAGAVGITLIDFQIFAT